MGSPSSPWASKNIQEEWRLLGAAADCTSGGEQISSKNTGDRFMKNIVMTALMLNLGVAGVYAEQRPVSMTFSGTGGPSAIDLKQLNANTAEENVAGSGTL
jgi:hypothetical protein